MTSYRIPKETDAPAPQAEAAPQGVPEAAPAGEPADFRWVAPEAWQSQPASGMRLASYRVPGPSGTSADVSVVSFPGSGGDDLANLNRWRGQVGLAPVAQADFASQVTSVRSAAGDLTWADLSGSTEAGPTRILGAWLRRDSKVWFFKMTGPAALVEAQREAFRAFVASLQPASAPAPSGPVPRKEAPRDQVHIQAARGESLLWTAPEGWTPQTGSSIRRGSYAVGSGAEVAITAFPGDVGGTLANVNRWREQAGLGAVDDAGLAKVTRSFDANGLHITVFDGTDGPRPIIAAQVPWRGQTWFVKLQGEAAGVAAAKPAFLEFLKTLRSP